MFGLFFGSEAIAEMLPLKIRRIVGIILLSAGIILGIIGLVFMILFQGSDLGLGGMGELIWLISIGVGAISILMSIDFIENMNESFESDPLKCRIGFPS
ncbi:MAG: hypothetical protein CMA72_02925 [Euryarchaeota archaeon]|nr:hypothetical protein [Euryarchaeota archaeon]